MLFLAKRISIFLQMKNLYNPDYFVMLLWILSKGCIFFAVKDELFFGEVDDQFSILAAVLLNSLEWSSFIPSSLNQLPYLP